MVTGFYYGVIDMESIKTIEDVKTNVEAIEGGRDDPENAHWLEDNLYEAVLREVVAGNPESKEMAKEALKTKAFDFPRWCA